MVAHEEHVREAASRFILAGPGAFLRRVENWIYDFDEDDAVLRLSSPARRSIGQLNAELEWMDYLAEHGIGVASPRRSRSGAYVEEIFVRNRMLNAVVFEKVRGRHISSPEEYTEDLLHTWGSTLGAMHSVTQHYRPKGERRPDWHAESGFRQSVEAMELPNSARRARERFGELLTWADSLDRTKATYGLVHCDLHSGNFFLDRAGRLICFDFDDCQYQWFGYDIAVPLFLILLHWQNRAVQRELSDALAPFLEGYWRGGGASGIAEADVRAFLQLRAAMLFHWCKARLDRGEFDARGIEWANTCLPFARDVMDGRIP